MQKISNIWRAAYGILCCCILGLIVVACKRGKENVIVQHWELMRDILESAIAQLSGYSKKGFLMKLFGAVEADTVFVDIDNEMTQCVQDITLALQVEGSVCDEERTVAQENRDAQLYNMICDIQKKFDAAGGLLGVQHLNQKELAKLTAEIGIRDTVTLAEEVPDCVSHMEAFTAKVVSDVEDVKKKIAESDPYLSSLTLMMSAVSIPSSTDMMITHALREKIVIDRTKLLGSGAFGSVYGGVYSGQTVAVKVFNSALFSSGSMEKHLKREITLHLEASKCLGVVQVLGVALHPNEYVDFACVVMERAIGSLHDAVHSNNPCIGASLFVLLPLMQQIGSAMEFIGSTGLIHRDIKSSNVLLFKSKDSRNGICAKICDFGLSKSNSNGLTVTSSADMSKAKGSPAYMAPEVFDAIYSSASDVYAYSIMLNEVLSGQVPYKDVQSLPELIKGVCTNNKRPAIYNAKGAIGDSLRFLITSCWHKDPLRRQNFSNITAVLASLMQASLEVCIHGSNGADKVLLQSLCLTATVLPQYTANMEKTVLEQSSATTTDKFHIDNYASSTDKRLLTPIPKTGISNIHHNRPLESLSVGEVGGLMELMQLPLADMFSTKRVSGLMLSYCEDANDLISSHYGISSKGIANGLMRQIEIWKVNGVPIDGKLIDGKPIDGKPIDEKPINGKLIDGKVIDGKLIDGKLIDGKTCIFRFNEMPR